MKKEEEEEEEEHALSRVHMAKYFLRISEYRCTMIAYVIYLELPG
jgi:hypothetical protein